MHQVNIGKLFIIIFFFIQQRPARHTSTLSEANYKAYSISHNFFAYIFCGKTNKNTLSKLSAQKMVNALSSSVASWRGKKDIQQNPKNFKTFAFVRFQFP